MGAEKVSSNLTACIPLIWFFVGDPESTSNSQVIGEHKEGLAFIGCLFPNSVHVTTFICIIIIVLCEQ